MNLYDFDEFNSLTLEPEDNADFNNWIFQEDIVQYLESEVRDEYIIIYASLPHTYLYAALIPDINPEEYTATKCQDRILRNHLPTAC